jgi:O-antigen/teichoic acid export membrane protein
VAWNLVATLFNQGSLLVGGWLVARICGRDRYGDFAMVQSTLFAVAGLVQFLTGLTATKYIAEFRSTDKSKAGEILALCSAMSLVVAVLGAVVLLVAGDWLAGALLRAPHLGVAMRLSAGVLLFSLMAAFQVGALAGLECFASSAKAAVVSGVLLLGAIGLGAWQGGVNGALIGWGIAAMVKWCLFELAVYRNCRRQGITMSYRGMFRQWGIIFRFAIPSAAMGITAMPALWLGNVFLYRLPDGKSQVAIFGAAFIIRQAVLLVPTIINGVAMSLLNHQRGLGDARRYRKVFWANLLIGGMVVAVFTGVAVLIGPYVMLIFGKDFTGGGAVLTVLVLSALPYALMNAIYQIMFSQGRLWLSFFAFSIPRDALLVGCAYILVPRYGAFGLAWAHMIGLLVVFLIVTFFAVRIGLDIHDSRRA